MNNTEQATGEVSPRSASVPKADLVDQVRQAWAEVLDVDTVPLDINFFDLGGNSLLLLLLWESLNEMTSRDLKAADLFQHSTVEAQAIMLAAPEDNRELSVLGARDRRRLLGRAHLGPSFSGQGE